MTPRRASRFGLALLASMAASSCTVGDASSGGDPDAVIEGMARADMPDEARRLLDTDRPWRAARVMRRYLEGVDDPTVPDRILAARAEAGWGAWDRVLELLDGVDGLADREGGLGVYLLARARDESGDSDGAVQAYQTFLDLPAAAPGADGSDASAPSASTADPSVTGSAATPRVDPRQVARLRLGLALLRLDRRADAAPALEVAARNLGGGAAWLPLLEADALAQAGDTAAVRTTVDGIEDGLMGLHAWRARIEAARTAGDHAAARALANQARAWARTDGTQAEFLLAAGREAIEMGDRAAGRDALRAAIDKEPGGRHARAAGELLGEGDISPEDHRALARVQVEQGLQEESLDHYRKWLDSGLGSASERREVRLAYADALYYAGRFDEVAAALEPLGDDRDATSKVARAHAHMDEFDDAARIFLELARRGAGSGTGEQALYLAADVRHDEGNTEAARTIFRRLLSEYPSSNRRGLIMMRLAGMAFQQEDYAEAARLWDEYLGRYPQGSMAEQATYWSGRAHEEAGDTARANARYRAVRDADRESYYALVASERLAVPFWPIPMTDSPPADAAATARVAAWMRGIDLLAEAGFPEAASAEVDRVVGQVGSNRPNRYALAEALAERGYAMRAIRLAIGLKGSSTPNPRLMRILYPFPYRTLITEEARERGFDPFVAAALIRQESLFEARITSYVGARGLMQMMPATGREVADAAGLDRWDPELLYLPEINVHLGTKLVADYLDDYEGSLPSVFSAYNAGPHRVEWWSDFPEYGNDQLFTERIPYGETRDYVKILTRNRALYEGLYGADVAASPGGSGRE